MKSINFSFFSRSTKIFLVLFLVLIMLSAIYIGNLLFGKNSLIVLENLNLEANILTKQISSLKLENTKFHKKYIELKSLEPEF